MKTILAPTDLSARSDIALRRAVKLAAEHGAHLNVTHVIDDAAPADLRDEIRKSAEKTLEARIAALSGDVPYTLWLSEGDPIADILTHISDTSPDLVVMGLHRPRSFLDVLHETTVQRVTRLSPATVLMVASDRLLPYQSVLAATDFSPASTAAIHAAHKLSPGAPITPIHAFEVPHTGMLPRAGQGGDVLRKSFHADAVAANRAWRTGMELPETCTDTTFIEGSPLHALLTEGPVSEATLIALGAHGRVGQQRALLGSTATDLMRRPPCDMLIARPHAKLAHSGV